MKMKPIPGYDGYAADEKGNIFSFWKRGKGSKGYLVNEPVKKLKGNRSWTGHLKVDLKGGRVEFVHRLVYRAFNGDIPKGLIVRHLNDIPDDNRPENLCLGTFKDNSADSKRNGSFVQGEKTHNAKLTEDDVRTIRNLYDSGNYYQREIGDMFNIKDSTVCNIVNRKTWKHVD